MFKILLAICLTILTVGCVGSSFLDTVDFNFFDEVEVAEANGDELYYNYLLLSGHYFYGPSEQIGSYTIWFTNPYIPIRYKT